METWAAAASSVFPSQEGNVPIQDLVAASADRNKKQEEKAIVSAMTRYFEGTPPRNADGAEMEPSILNALHRYFEVKK